MFSASITAFVDYGTTRSMPFRKAAEGFTAAAELQGISFRIDAGWPPE
jgi:uncharacterized protein YhdP